MLPPTGCGLHLQRLRLNACVLLKAPRGYRCRYHAMPPMLTRCSTSVAIVQNLYVPFLDSMLHYVQFASALCMQAAQGMQPRIQNCSLFRLICLNTMQ